MDTRRFEHAEMERKKNAMHYGYCLYMCMCYWEITASAVSLSAKQ